ncbi:hypothetical protein CLV59_104303 [Chitinophaga dinghuensis]|uniref:Phosphate-selective porin O/P n=1 Tax=Chitinophaga dinghuensis TaxID=1539050 RepID=A0A327W7S2_9BACT|nr:hypothetical protein [Chitinophaga dinghuensis]RAJ82078.1 hypothetical protein CLV59_104303 [Chitinophaga dinghuensis]
MTAMIEESWMVRTSYAITSTVANRIRKEWKIICCCLFLFFPMITNGQDSTKINDKPKLHIGGALRFNYNNSSWKKEQVKRGGDFGYDMFRINADAAWKQLSLHAEYRFYSKDFGGGMLKEGYVTWHFNDSTRLDIGLTQVPFGNITYNSHSWFFNLPYYVGKEDDYDMGIKFERKARHWKYQLAFFKNAEELNFGDKTAIDPGRYSYDVAGRNKEVNQGNARVEYLLENNSSIGASLMAGGLYNIPSGEMGSHYAEAVHANLNWKRWNLKLQSLYYQYNVNDSTQFKNAIDMAAYGASYQVAAKAFIHTASLAYTLPVKWGPVSTLTFYNDYSLMDKTISGFENTQMNVLGCMVTAGPVFTYIDWAAGKNHPWLGPVWDDALASGTPGEKWHSRFNINIGYYF